MYKEPLIVIKDDFYIESLTSLDLYQDQFVGKRYRLAAMFTDLITWAKSVCLGKILHEVLCRRLCTAGDPGGSRLPWTMENDMYAVALGTIEKRQLDGKDVLVIVAKTVDTQDAPSSPYVYQNPYFGS